LPERIESIKNPFIIPPAPPFNTKGGEGGLLFFDVNITIKKVNEKNPLETLLDKSFS
jgi:hypothetical protein